MSGIGWFLMSVGVCVTVTGAAAVVLRRSMTATLYEVCGSRAGASGWVTLGWVSMLLGVTAASTVPDASLLAPSADSTTLLRNSIVQCAFGLAGVLASLLILAGAFLSSIAKYEARGGVRSVDARPGASPSAIISPPEDSRGSMTCSPEEKP